MTMNDPLAVALDRFTAPPVSAGLADRIVAQATRSTSTRPARDRRGMWRRGRQVVFGSLAFGMISAAALASGLLGKVGIEVPGLSEILAPKPVVVAATAKPKPKVVPKPVPVAPPPVVAPTVDPVEMQRAAFLERRAERRARIEKFAQEHPVAAQRIRENVRRELRVREEERRALLGFPPTDPAAADFRPLTPEERVILQDARRQDMRRAVQMFQRRIEAREARLAAQRAADDESAVNAAAPAEAAANAVAQ